MKHPLFHLIKDKPLLESLANEYGTPLYLYDKFLWMVIDISAGLMFVINSKEIKD